MVCRKHTHMIFFPCFWFFFFAHTHTLGSMFLVSYIHKQKAHLMAISDDGQSEPTTTNALIGHFSTK